MMAHCCKAPIAASCYVTRMASCCHVTTKPQWKPIGMLPQCRAVVMQLQWQPWYHNGEPLPCAYRMTTHRYVTTKATCYHVSTMTTHWHVTTVVTCCHLTTMPTQCHVAIVARCFHVTTVPIEGGELAQVFSIPSHTLYHHQDMNKILLLWHKTTTKQNNAKP